MVQPIKKNFNPKSVFPLEIVFQDTKTPQRELPNHFHDWYEIVYVYSGTGSFFIEGSIYQMKKGDLFTLPGNSIHYSIPDSSNPVTSTAIFFNPVLVQNRNLGDTFSFLDIFEKSVRFNHYQHELNHSDQQKMEDILERMYTETSEKEYGYRHSILNYLQLLLIYFNRTILLKRNHHKTSNSYVQRWLEEVFAFIENHYTEDITLTDLSLHANVSIAHLSRVFKQMTGLNISEYIVTKRILLAKDILLKTEENNANIASQCGFESLPHFYRTFRKYIGMTPSQYRKQHHYDES
ncbi:AraC family transcriptional regulator [Gracilibacillus saliphilus]|uniref:AraC family transcriptional regulator n=1 Tax=Gracilibacillus saliphilus TaxID=543890 RepID=UPI0013D2BC26|nr:AraC family transcriptional regulator [Gracilibacillus saliphilus]